VWWADGYELIAAIDSFDAPPQSSGKRLFRIRHGWVKEKPMVFCHRLCGV
jgi:hypothetical protein